MACACAKNRTSAKGAAAVSGTYRVMVGTRKVYETTNPDAAATLAEKYDPKVVKILKPGESE